MKKLLMPTLVLVLILMFASASFAQATIADDGYHFESFSSSQNVADYGEWWFFNFYQSDIKGVIQYSLWNPADASPSAFPSFGLMFVSIQRNSETLDVFFPIPWSYIVTSESTADLIMGPESISVASGVYTLNGYVADEFGNEVSWNLQYVQQIPSLNGIRNLPTSPSEKMNWFVQMPSAVVSGVIIVNGETVVIDARGYHDHNWGTWKLSDTVWNWFQTSTPDWAIIGYDFYDMHKGQITVQFGSQTVTFKKNQYTVLNQEYVTTSPIPELPFPQKTTVLASNDEYTLMLNIEVSSAETGYVAVPYPDVTWVVLESNAVFSGFLVGQGTCLQISSVGFREYALDIPTF